MDLNNEEAVNLEENLISKPSDKFSEIDVETQSNKQANKSCDRVEELLNILQRNRSGCDLILCFFIAALKSYRADRCLRPFPQYFISENNEKDFNLLRNICDNIPSLEDIIKAPKHLSEDILKLLLWLFVDRGKPILKQCSMNNIPVPSKNLTPRPHRVFEVCYQDKVEESWENRINSRGVFFAFHGSAIDNFYSIVKVGLQQHFSIEKEVLFGDGVYLSSELSVCTHYAPFGQTWKNSAIGSNQSIIAVCEIINDIDKVKCKDRKNRERSINQNSLGEIPEKYFVVTDSEMVRVKYLLVYKGNSATSMKSFIISNSFWIILMFYFVMLMIIGIFNGPYYTKIVRWLTNKLLI